MAGVTGPLLSPAWRRRARVVALVGLAVFLALAVLTFHGRSTSVDSWVFRKLPGLIRPQTASFLLQFTEPAVSVVLLALLVVLAASARRFDVVVLAVVAPVLGTLLASDVAKPLIHRTLFDGTVGSFPSGHQTGVTCTATVLLVAFGQLPLHRAARYVLAGVLLVWVVITAVALTRYYYHYATDTLGAIGLSVAVVLGLSTLLDRVGARWARPGPAPATPRPRPRPGPARRSTPQRRRPRPPVDQLTPRP
ncbi:phosphatase PAP2 family protein [uncultured Jatrophihabitans sp.]|uniref:phosphatase PAP2 family protein n=1 Tax=uncultured Jatrophihabitans sp. TaxID=1610747 RepID=UPI0035CA7345